MMMRFFAVAGCVVLAGCVAQAPTPAAAPAAAAREEFVFASTLNSGSYKYACTPGGSAAPAARAAEAHAAFDQALSTFAASQTSVAQAAIAAGRTGAALEAEMQGAGDAFSADQRTKLDSQYGCVPAGQA
jgi:hypothetical protein